MNPQTKDPPQKHTYWEKAFQTPWGRYLAGIEREAVIEAMRRAGRPSLACDIGADAGRLSRLMAAAGWKLVCTDTNSESLALCKERLPSAECILVSPQDSSIPCETASVGIVLCIEVPQVMLSRWFLDEAYRVLQPSGMLVAVFWNRASLRGLVSAALSHFGGTPDYHRISYPAWRRRARKKGFDFIYQRGFSWFLWKREWRFPPVAFCRRLEQLLGLWRVAAVSPEIVFIARKNR